MMVPNVIRNIWNWKHMEEMKRKRELSLLRNCCKKNDAGFENSDKEMK